MKEPEQPVNDRFEERLILDEIKDSYLNYAMSVIVSRALPDVRDGLKPSQRRILVAMNDLNLGPRSTHRKCAKIVGDTGGNYHPHGDQATYGTLVRLGQSWAMRYPLVDPQGNFGSIDADPPAAMRYTEARMAAPATEMMADINFDTVDFVPNYDETREEPTVLPSRFPNLLVNGSTGIAVGMATNIAPHNLRRGVRRAAAGHRRSEVRVQGDHEGPARAGLSDGRHHLRPQGHCRCLYDRPRPPDRPRARPRSNRASAARTRSSSPKSRTR